MLYVNDRNRITNGENYYYQNKNGLHKIGNTRRYAPPIFLFRVGKKLLPKKDVVLAKLHNPDAFFRRISGNYVKHRRFTSRSEWNAGSIFLVFDPKNHRNVINYFKMKSILPHETFTSRNNNVMKKSKNNFDKHARTIQNRWRKKNC